MMAVCLLGSSLFRATPARGEALPAGTQFRRAYQAIILADEARDTGDFPGAMKLYEDALSRYTGLAQMYPEWQASMTKFRISYCKDQLQSVLTRIASSGGLEKSSPPSPESSSPEMPAAGSTRTEHYAARELLKSGKPEEARKLLMNELLKAPDDISVRLLVGIARCQEGKFSDARYVLEPVVEEAPGNQEAHVALGAAYFGLSRIADAKEALSQAISLDPKCSEAYFNMAHILMIQERPDIRAARAYYRKSVQTGGDSDPDLERALGL